MSGQHHTEETKRKIKEKMKGNKNGFGPNGIIGRHPSEEILNKLRKAQRGDKNPNWRGGIWEEPYPSDWTDDLKESIRKRDKHTCQMSGCGIHQNELVGWHKKLSVHHIDYNKDNLDPKNLISLCDSCHQKTNFNRGYWIVYFS